MSIDPRTLARTSDPLTSQLAAVDVLGSPRHSQRQRILAAIRAAGADGLTYEEAGDAAGVKNAWRRVSDLLQLQLIEPRHDAHGDVTRTLSSGRAGRVYTTPRGQGSLW